MRAGWGAVMLASVLVAATAGARAASADDNVRATTFLAKGFTVPVGEKPLLLMPGGVTRFDMREAEALVREELLRALRAAHLVVQPMRDADFEPAFQAAVDAGEPLRDLRSGVVLVVPHLKASSRVAVDACRAVDCALVIRYRVVFRDAAIVQDHYAEWDGARHGLEYANMPVARPGYHWTGVYSSGRAPATSVELIGFLPQGGIVFRTFGGLALSAVDDLTEKRWVPKDHPPSEAEVTEGVKLALDGWMTP